MKNNLLISLVAFSISLPTLAANQIKTYNLKMNISLDGKHIFSPDLTVKEGTKGFITSNGKTDITYIEVTATDHKTADGKQTVHLKFNIGKLNKDGSKTLTFSPEIIAIPNKKASIEVGENPKKELLALSVLATQLQ